jgi:hypothetical protein
VEADESSTIDRRRLIKRAAVLGATAWTAPAILGSIASPAAAVSGTACNLAIWTVFSANPNGSACTGSLQSITDCATPTSITPDFGCATPLGRIVTGTNPPNLQRISCATSGSQTVSQFTVNVGCSIIGYAVLTACAGASSVALTAHSGTTLNLSFTKNLTRYVYILTSCP